MTTLKLRFERKGRSGGSGVTVIEGFQSDPLTLDNLLKELKTALGCGGTRKGFALELQGDARPRLRDLLTKKKFRVKG